MTRDELRDRLKELVGWRQEFDRWSNQFPDNDLNPIAAVWDTAPLKDWYWGKCWGEMVAQKKGTNRQVTLPETGNFYADFLALTVAVLERERGSGGGK